VGILMAAFLFLQKMSTDGEYTVNQTARGRADPPHLPLQIRA